MLGVTCVESPLSFVLIYAKKYAEMGMGLSARQKSTQKTKEAGGCSKISVLERLP
jgi:hypothetical protein